MGSRFDYTWQLLEEHFGETHASDIVSTQRRWPAHLRPTVYAAIAGALEGKTATLTGVHQALSFEPLTVAGLSVRDPRSAVSITPLQYQDIDIGDAEPVSCLVNGLWAAHIEGVPVAVLLSRASPPGRAPLLQVVVAHPASAVASSFARNLFGTLEAAVASSRLYRGKVLSFDARPNYHGSGGDISVHRLPPVTRGSLILDAATMSRLDRHVFAFDRQRPALKALGQSTRKGLLLYGPPGTGKTHTIRYIASNLPDHTTLLITGGEVGGLTAYMELARALQPSLVVIEDVDLIGRAREQLSSDKAETLLNQLLNEMDGLREDADILFILTTNRPGEIEGALASRPGRIDEAIEIPLPDGECRRQLFALYGRQLQFDDAAMELAITESEGVSAAFVKECVRRFAQESLERGRGAVVSSDVVRAVLDDIMAPANSISRKLLAAGQSAYRPREQTCG